MRFIIDLPFVTFIILYFLLAFVVFIIHFIHSKNNKNKYSLFFKLSILLYILLLIKVAFLGIQITDESGYQIMKENGLLDNIQFIQLIPFRTIIKVLSYTQTLDVTYIQIVGNIILILPISILLHYIKRLSVKKTLLCCFFITLFIETYQLIVSIITRIPSHLFDIDENMPGALIGVGIFLFI